MAFAGSFRHFILIYLFSALLLGGCGGGDSKTKEKKEQTESLAERRLEIFRKRIESYKKLIEKKLQTASQWKKLEREAKKFLNYARRIGDKQSIEYFENELARIEKGYRNVGQSIFKKAERAAQAEEGAAPDPASMWKNRWEIWDECVGELNRKCPGNTKLIEKAEARRRQAGLMEKAHLLFTSQSSQAENAMEYDNSSEAVAALAVLRVWLRSHNLVSEDQAEAIEETSEEASAKKLYEKTNTLIAKYMESCSPEFKESTESEEGKERELASVPFREIEFFVDFTWNSEGGECNSGGDKIIAKAGENGGIIEALDDSWSELIMVFEAKVNKGDGFWVGARPVMDSASGRRNYKDKCEVTLGDSQWHKIRVQVLNDELRVVEVPEEGKELKLLGGPVQLKPTAARSVSGGFMIGLESGVEMELRGLKVKVLSGEAEPKAPEEEKPSGNGEGATAEIRVLPAA